MLQLVALHAHLLVQLDAAREDFGAQFGASGAEEVGFVLDVGLADERLAGFLQVVAQQEAHGFHDRDCLGFRPVAGLEAADEAVGVEVVDVARSVHVRRVSYRGRVFFLDVGVDPF